MYGAAQRYLAIILLDSGRKGEVRDFIWFRDLVHSLISDEIFRNIDVETNQARNAETSWTS